MVIPILMCVCDKALIINRFIRRRKKKKNVLSIRLVLFGCEACCEVALTLVTGKCKYPQSTKSAMKDTVNKGRFIVGVHVALAWIFFISPCFLEFSVSCLHTAQIIFFTHADPMVYPIFFFFFLGGGVV